jgi:hypothetical protein
LNDLVAFEDIVGRAGRRHCSACVAPQGLSSGVVAILPAAARPGPPSTDSPPLMGTSPPELGSRSTGADADEPLQPYVPKSIAATKTLVCTPMRISCSPC